MVILRTENLTEEQIPEIGEDLSEQLGKVLEAFWYINYRVLGKILFPLSFFLYPLTFSPT